MRDNKKIVLILIGAPIIVYFASISAKELFFYIGLPISGTKDTWINFAGSIIGGLITMVALYLTIHNDEKTKIRPYLVCNAFFEGDKKSLRHGSCVNLEMGLIPIKLQIKCANEAVATDFICESQKTEFSQYKFSDIDKNYIYVGISEEDALSLGISIFTVILDEKQIVSPYNDVFMRCNIFVNKIDNEGYLGDLVQMIHEITFSYKNIKGNDKKFLKFSFKAYVNIDVNDIPHIIIEEKTNTITDRI